MPKWTFGSIGCPPLFAQDVPQCRRNEAWKERGTSNFSRSRKATCRFKSRFVLWILSLLSVFVRWFQEVALLFLLFASFLYKQVVNLKHKSVRRVVVAEPRAILRPNDPEDGRARRTRLTPVLRSHAEVAMWKMKKICKDMQRAEVESRHLSHLKISSSLSSLSSLGSGERPKEGEIFCSKKMDDLQKLRYPWPHDH